MDINFDEFELSPIFRKDLVDKTKILCREEFIEFTELLSIFRKLDDFLELKCKEANNESKEYYTRLMNIRVKDHFSSAIILVSQGFNVDAISLTRSALEDLLLILNFYLGENYFEKWHKNKKSFEIKPVELRENKKIKKEDRDFYKKIYKNLCSIVHPRKNSIEHMLRFHPTIDCGGSEGTIRIKKDIKLINLSFFMHLFQVSNMLKKIYIAEEDITYLDGIVKDISEISSIYDFMSKEYNCKYGPDI